MNRYDNYTVSAYNPQSFEELAFVPALKRKKHDDLIAAQQTILDGLAKVDPLDVHFEHAKRLKNDIEQEVDLTSEELLKNGVNNDMIGKVIALNRKYHDLTSPTGEIGRINEAKKVYDSERNRFLTEASKQYGSERALQLWDIHKNNYTGYSDLENKNIKYIDSKGIVANQNFDQDLKLYNSLLGETVRSASNSGYKIQDSGIGDGSLVMVNKSGQTVKSDNIKQLNEQRKLLKSKWLDKTGEGFLFNQESGIDLDNFRNRFDSAIDMQLKSSSVKKEDVNANFIGGGSDKKQEEESLFGEEYNTKEVGGKDSESYKEISKIGLSNSWLGGKQYTDKVHSINDVKDVRQKSLYKQRWKEAISQGIIVDGRRIKFSQEDIKKGMDNRKNAERILKSLEQSPITLTSRLLTSNQILNNKGFVAGLGDNAEDVDKNIRRQLQRSDSSARKLVDPETGNTITWNEAMDKYNLDDINNVKYQGQISPHNWENTSFLGTNSKFSPHVITARDKDGKWYSFQTTRLSSDNIGGNVDRQNELQENYRAATLSHGRFIDFSSKSNNFKGIKIMYNPDEQEVDERTGEPKMWSVKFPNGEVKKTTESKYMNWVNSVR